MKHWFRKFFATKSPTPRRESLENVMSDIELLKSKYANIDMELIDFEIVKCTCSKDFKDNNGEVWTSKEPMQYALCYFYKKERK